MENIVLITYYVAKEQPALIDMLEDSTVRTIELGILQTRQEEWQRRLSAVSLVAEFAVDPGAAKEALTLLGFRYRALRGEQNSSSRWQLLRKFSAVHLVVTTYVASEYYDNGGLWPQLAAAIGVPNTQSFHDEWGSAFIYNLEALGLPSFKNIEDAGQTYIGRILIHSGIPTRCLNDYFRIISEQRKKNPDLSAEELVTWATSRAHEGRLYNVDTPVKRFLQFGGEFAVDVTDRSFDLLDSIADGENPTDALLPKRFIAEAIELAKDGKITRSASEGNRQHSQRPRLALDPYSGTPVVKLPSVQRINDETVTWKVAFDNNPPEVITSYELWPGSNEPAPEVTVSIHQPARIATVTLQQPQGVTVNVGIINENDTLVAFEENGAHIAAGFDLPSGPVWVLLPGEPSSMTAEGELRVLTSATLPAGWDGWSLVLVDLAETASVAFGGVTRQVRKFKSARITPESPIESLRTLTGMPVYGAIPDISLPSDAEWEVTLMGESRRFIKKLSTSEQEDLTGLWSEEARPLLGEYTVRIRGPWGRGVTSTFFIAEGLRIATRPSLRRMSKSGLDTARVTIDAPDGMLLDKTMLTLEPDQIRSTLTATVENRSAYFSVSVPYMFTIYHSDNKPGLQSVKSISAHTEDVLEKAGSLAVHSPECEDATFYVSVDGSDVQIIAEATYRNGTYRLNLERLTDTLSRYKQLVIEFSDARIPLMSIRPKKLFSKAMLSAENDELFLPDCVDIQGMTALLYAATAPWKTPWITPVHNKRCTVPPELRHAGDLVVYLRIEDEWTTTPPAPEWPHDEEAVTVSNDGYYTGGSEEENAVAAFLGGEVKRLPEHIEHFPIIWSIYNDILPDLRRKDTRSHIVISINKALEAQAKDALLTIENSTLPADDITSLLISTGMVWKNLNLDEGDHLPIWTMRNALPSTLLSAADRSWSDEEIDSSVEVLGSCARDIYSGNDPFATAGRFDEGSDRFASMPELREHFINSMQLVPSGLISGDSRVSASLKLIEKRNSSNTQWIRDNAGLIIGHTRELLRSLKSPLLTNAFEVRQHPFADDGWQAVSGASLGIALLARMAARDHTFAMDFFEVNSEGNGSLSDISKMQTIVDRREGWANFAKAAPEMATIDIILAELLIASTEKQGI